MNDVQVILRGPVLAVLCFAEWLQLLHSNNVTDKISELFSEGTVDLHTEAAEWRVAMPCSMVYDLVSNPAPTQARVRRIGAEYRLPHNGTTHVATYLLRLEIAAPQDGDAAV
jgi:hypothetical protein